MPTFETRALVPAELFVGADKPRAGWRWTERGTLKKVGGQLGAAFCGGRGLRGGVHALALRVEVADGAEIEFGAVEAMQAAAIVDKAQIEPEPRRFTSLRVEDGDLIVLILDLVMGIVAVLRGGEPIVSGRSSPMCRIPARILDHGLVTPFVLAKRSGEPELSMPPLTTVEYDVHDMFQVMKVAVAGRAAMQNEARERMVAKRPTLRTVSMEVIQGERGVHLHACVGDVVYLPVYQHDPSNYCWEFEVVGDDGILVLVEDSSIVSGYTYQFFCREVGTVDLYFGFVHSDALEQCLDNFLTVHVEEAEPSASNTRCLIS